MMKHPPHRVLFTSFRRGIGKSTLAANLAVQAACAGKRIALVEAAFASPALSSFFKLNGQATQGALNEVLLGQKRMDRALVDLTNAYVESGSGELWLVPASQEMKDIVQYLNHPYDLARLDAEIQDLYANLDLDYVLIDGPSGFDENSLSLFPLADTLLVVLQPDSIDYQGTAVLVDLARRLSLPDIRLVLNGTPAAYDVMSVRTQVEAVYGCQVAGILPNAEAVAACGSSGIFVQQSPEHEYSRACRTLVSNL